MGHRVQSLQTEDIKDLRLISDPIKCSINTSLMGVSEVLFPGLLF